VGWSLAMAVVSTFGLAGLLVGSANAEGAELEIVGMLGSAFGLIPSIIGTAVGFAVREPRLHTPTIAWIGIVWNGVILSTWLLLMIIGMMS
jgi:hypothetical protein